MKRWQDICTGRTEAGVFAPGCPTREAIAQTEYPQKAFELSQSYESDVNKFSDDGADLWEVGFNTSVADNLT